MSLFWSTWILFKFMILSFCPRFGCFCTILLISYKKKRQFLNRILFHFNWKKFLSSLPIDELLEVKNCLMITNSIMKMKIGFLAYVELKIVSSGWIKTEQKTPLEKNYYQESYEIPSFYQVFIEENERKSCAIVNYFCTLII